VLCSVNLYKKIKNKDISDAVNLCVKPRHVSGPAGLVCRLGFLMQK